MEEQPINDRKTESGRVDRAVFVRFATLLFVGLLVAYGKFLWPLIFGRMHSEGISFMAAIHDASLHLIAFIMLAVSWVAAVFLVFLSGAFK